MFGPIAPMPSKEDFIKRMESGIKVIEKICSCLSSVLVDLGVRDSYADAFGQSLFEYLTHNTQESIADLKTKTSPYPTYDPTEELIKLTDQRNTIEKAITSFEKLADDSMSEEQQAFVEFALLTVRQQLDGINVSIKFAQNQLESKEIGE